VVLQAYISTSEYFLSLLYNYLTHRATVHIRVTYIHILFKFLSLCTFRQLGSWDFRSSQDYSTDWKIPVPPECAVHIEDCEGWWLFDCCSSVIDSFKAFTSQKSPVYYSDLKENTLSSMYQPGVGRETPAWHLQRNAPADNFQRNTI